jgi:taurine dioxygenase
MAIGRRRRMILRRPRPTPAWTADMTEPAKPIPARLEVRPLTPTLGAEVRGVRLSGDLSSATVAYIRDALLRHRVVFFRGQNHLDDAGHEAVARLLGPIVPHPTVPPIDGTDTVIDIDGEKARASYWHTDVTFNAAFPQFCILRSVVVPPVGGDTMWADAAAAHATLPPVLRGLAEQLWALHSNAYDYAEARPNATARQGRYYTGVFASVIHEAAHPMAQVHPLTGERALVLGGFVRRVLGVDAAQSKHLFAVLQDHVTRPENTVRWRWSAGDVAIWDNRATQHRAIDDYGDQPRILRRVAVAGPVSVAVDGRNGEDVRAGSPGPGDTLQPATSARIR